MVAPWRVVDRGRERRFAVLGYSDYEPPVAALPSGFALAKLSIRANPDPALVAHLSRQLDAVQKLFGYRYGRSDAETATLTQGLARFLASYDVRDIRDVQPCSITIADWRAEGSTGQPIGATIACDDRTGVHLYDYTRGYVEDFQYEPPRQVEDWIARGNSETIGWVPGQPLPVAIVELPDRYYVIFSAKWTEGGVPYFIPQIKRRSSLSEDLRFILGAALMVVPGVNAVVGNALFGGTFLAQYPALMSIATNTIVSTTLNGGDIEAAIVGALSGHAGGIVGGQVASGLDSVLAGRLASVATSAALQGGDVDKAVQNALLRYGAGAAGEFVSDVVETATTQPGPVPVFDIDLEADAQQVQPATLTPVGGSMDWDSGVEFGSDFGDFGLASMQGTALGDDFGFADMNLDTFDFGSIANPLMPAIDYSDADFAYDGESNVPYIAPENFADADFDYNGAGVAPSSQAPYIPAIDYADADFGYGEGVQTTGAPVAGSVPAPSGGYSFADGIRDVSSLAMAAIQISAAYQRTQAPPVQAGARTSTSGNTVTGQSNGMVTVRSPSGQVVAQKPPVGVPYGTADGSVVVNNGDGTYTIATNTGATVTRPYASAVASSGFDGKTVAIVAGVGLLALLALR